MHKPKYGPKPKPAHDRFFAKVKKTKKCWLWLGTKNNHGYGMFMLQSPNKILAHRAAWLLAGNTLPEGSCLLHSCDNQSCVNPAHLRVGTQAENMAEMRAKGRHKFVAHYGRANGQTKLLDSEVAAILAAHATGRFTHAKLAEIFKVSRPRITQIVGKEPRARVDQKTDEQGVRKIRHLAEDGFSHQEIANTVGLSKGRVTQIVTRRAWAHVE